MKQIPNNNKATMNNKVTAKQTKKQRKAEANHKKHGRSEDFTSMHITLACTSKCMKDIRKKRYAA